MGFDVKRHPLVTGRANFYRNLESSLGHQACLLKDLLECKKIPAIKCWADIDRLSKEHRLWDRAGKETGCAFKKIGRMLQGLGILDVSWKDGRDGRRQEKIMAELSPETASAASAFIKALLKQNRSQRTATVYLENILKYEQRLRTISPDRSVILANSFDLESYLDYLQKKKFSMSHTHNRYYSLNKFYRWCFIQKKLMVNPAQSVTSGRPCRPIEVCSEADLRTLIAYVKNPETDPVDAFFISLVLFFGFTIEQLCLAQLAPPNGATLRIIIATHRRTFSNRFKRPSDHLDLPSTPNWFLKLQRRYASHWQERYAQFNHISVRRPLFLQENKWFNAPIDPSVLEHRLRRATRRALGDRSIPWRILHSSCGVLYTRYQDASILTRLGWSQKHASHYVYVTKKIHSPSTDK